MYVQARNLFVMVLAVQAATLASVDLCSLASAEDSRSDVP